MFTDFSLKKLILILLLALPFVAGAQDNISFTTDQKSDLDNGKYSLLPKFYFFEKHGICLDSMGNFELYKNIIPWIGTRYRYGGRTKKGIDCSGFVKAILDSTYGIKFMGGSASIAKEVEVIDRSQLKEGDLLFFYNRGRKRIGHIALYLGNNKFVHSACGTGITISDLNEPWYAKRFVMAGRIDKLIYRPNNQGSHSEKLLLFK